MLLKFFEILEIINEFLFGKFDNFIESFNFPDWVCDAILDSFHSLPFLLIIFIIIELVEYYWSDKIHTILAKSKQAGPVVGGLVSIFPQCGFSIIASSLYSRRFITRGTLIAIYLATSDEAIPVLLSYPDKIYLLIPLLFTKLVIAIIAGYLVDIFVKTKLREMPKNEHHHNDEEGCCKHDIVTHNKVNLWFHPVLHTLNIFAFIFVITFVLNFFLEETPLTQILSSTNNLFISPIITAIIGLIPNCAVSVTLTLMLIKGTISFGSAVSGLCANAGLGLLVLLRKNKVFKDTVFITWLLILISIVSGILIDIISRFGFAFY